MIPSGFDDEPAEPGALTAYIRKQRDAKSSSALSVKDAPLLAPH